MFLNKIKRFYPPAAQLADRRAVEDDKIQGVFIPAGV